MRATAAFMQPDLFAAALPSVEVAPPTPSTKSSNTRRRKVAKTSLEARERAARATPTHAERVLLDVKGNGKMGRTRQELADRTNIKLQSVCGVVALLLKQGALFEPVIGWDGPTAIHFRRDGRTVLVDALYQDTFDWLAFGQRIHG